MAINVVRLLTGQDSIYKKTKAPVNNEPAIPVSALISMYRDQLDCQSRHLAYGETKAKADSAERISLDYVRETIAKSRQILEEIEKGGLSDPLETFRLLVSLISSIDEMFGSAAGSRGNKVRTARNNAQARHSSTNSKKAAEKEFVKSCWIEWRQSPLKYPSKAAFARDMLEKCQELNSSKVIERWCKKWEAEP